MAERKPRKAARVTREAEAQRRANISEGRRKQFARDNGEAPKVTLVRMSWDKP